MKFTVNSVRLSVAIQAQKRGISATILHAKGSIAIVIFSITLK